MKMLDRLKASDEDFIKKFDDDYLSYMNDEELMAEVYFSLGQMTRLQENLDALKGAFEGRELEYPASKGEDIGANTKTEEEDYDSGTAVLKLAGTAGDNPFIAFVGASPSKLDMVRGQHFTGPVGKTLKSAYFSGVKVGKSDVLLTTIVKTYVTDETGHPRVPNKAEMQAAMPELRSELEKHGIKFVVGLGREASEVLKEDGILDEFVPHPRAVNIYGDRGEVGRKLARLAKKVARKDDIAPKIAPSEPLHMQLIKTEEEQQVVLGVVIEPEVEDTDGNWTDATEIEKTAYDFMIHSQQMGVEHFFKADEAVIVESYLAPVDFTLGDENVTKGSWVLGVKVLDETQWEMVKSGEFNGFSFGGSAKIDPSLRLE